MSKNKPPCKAASDLLAIIACARLEPQVRTWLEGGRGTWQAHDNNE